MGNLLWRDPASQKPLLVLTMSSTSKSSYFRYIYCQSLYEETMTKCSKRSRMHSFRFSGMASTFQEPHSRPCLHYQRISIVLKVAALKIPSICQASRWTTFGPFCASYIRCAFRCYSIRVLISNKILADSSVSTKHLSSNLMSGLEC